MLVKLNVYRSFVIFYKYLKNENPTVSRETKVHENQSKITAGLIEAKPWIAQNSLIRLII